MDMEIYDELIEAIYQAPFENLGWQQVVSKLLRTFDPKKEVHSQPNCDESIGNLTPGMPSRDNPHRLSGDTPVSSSDHSQWDISQPATVDSSISDQNLTKQADVDQQTKLLFFGKLNRHIRKAAQIGTRMNRLSSANCVFVDALDQLRLGVLFLDREARIHNMNAYARKLIEQNDVLIVKASRLELLRNEQREMLRNSLARAAATGGSATFSLPRRHQPPLSVCIVPCTDTMRFGTRGDSALMLFISDPDDREKVDATALAQRWRLTTLEAEIVLLMVKGLRIKQIADRMGLTESTTRWYSKQIMGKVGVKRQAELNTRLMKDIAFLLTPAKPARVNA